MSVTASKRGGPAPIDFSRSVVTVTPAMAAEWLAKGDNRVIRKGTVRKYLRAMQRGEWRPAQPILLDENGYCLDGQHRLMAVIEHGEPVDFVVLAGMPRDTTYTVLDEGTPRFLFDKIKSERARLFAAAARYSWVLDETTSGGSWQADLGTNLSGISHSMMVDYYNIIKDELEQADSLMPEVHGRLLSRSFMIALFMHFRRRDPELAERFMNPLVTGQDLTQGSLLMYLRDRIIEERLRTRSRGPGGQSTRVLVAWIIKAWNVIRHDPTMEHDLHWGTARRLLFSPREQFPSIE